ncbi:MAG: site-2 protease family protein, partial [Planctomycetota bacterium]|nr:site-2 protease family protein [Planctomycetota bacterium]
VLGPIERNGPAATHGLKSGDRILAVDGRPVQSFEELQRRIFEAQGRQMVLEVERYQSEGQRQRFQCRIAGVPSQGRGRMAQIGAERPISRAIGGLSSDPRLAPLRRSLDIGDEIIALHDGKEWRDIPPSHGHLLLEIMEPLAGQEITLRVKKANRDEIREIKAPVLADGIPDLGLRFFLRLNRVSPGSPAEAAGLKAEDRLVSAVLQGEERFFLTAEDLIACVNAAALQPLILGILRNGERQEITVKPRPRPGDPRLAGDEDNLLGIKAAPTAQGFRVEALWDEANPSADWRVGDLIVDVRSAAAAAEARPLLPQRSLREQIDEASALAITLKVQRGAERLAVSLKPRMDKRHGRPMIGVEQNLDFTVAHIMPHSFCAKYLGDRLKPGAVIRDLSPTLDLRAVAIAFASRPGEESKELVLPLPEEIRRRPGDFGLKGRPCFDLVFERQVVPAGGLGKAMAMAAAEWLDMSVLIYKVIHRLLARELPVETLGGPILLMRSIKTAHESGFWYVVWLVAMISINLGICNLLPIPVLDGGHLLFLLIHWLRGAPPHPRILEFAQYLGLVLLLALLATVTWFDIKYF